MRFVERLKPLHGWRAFAGEVGVVVLGVLVALGVDQAARTFDNRRDAAEAREAIRAEIVTNLTRVNQRTRAQACIDRRLDEIQTVLDARAADNRIARIDWIGRPSRYALETQRWTAAMQSGRASNFSADEQARYGFLVTSFAYAYDMLNEEQLVWSRIAALQGVTRLSDDGALTLSAALSEARFYNGSIRQVTTIQLDRAKALGLHPTRRRDRLPPICWPATLPAAEGRARLAARGMG